MYSACSGQFLFNALQAITEQQKKVHEAEMEQLSNMIETKLKALGESLREELRADTEEQVREKMVGVVEEKKKEVKEDLIPQCEAVVKEMRGQSYLLPV